MSRRCEARGCWILKAESNNKPHTNNLPPKQVTAKSMREPSKSTLQNALNLIFQDILSGDEPLLVHGSGLDAAPD